MKYACNFSLELLELLKDNDSLCDYIKIGAFGDSFNYLDEAFSYKPLILHGFGWYERGGMKDCSVMNYEYINSMMKKYKSPFLGMHAIAFSSDIDNMKKPVLEHMIKIFNEIKGNLQSELIIENMDSSPFYSYETTTPETVTPRFLSTLLETTGLSLLLDISHALVSSYQLGIPIYDYLEQLPLEIVKEIHFTGSFFRKEHGYLDIHGIMDDEDMEIAGFLANNPRIKNANKLEIVTLEYGKLYNANKEAIEKQLYELKLIFD